MRRNKRDHPERAESHSEVRGLNSRDEHVQHLHVSVPHDYQSA